MFAVFATFAFASMATLMMLRYAGMEQQPVRMISAAVLCLAIALGCSLAFPMAGLLACLAASVAGGLGGAFYAKPYELDY